VLKEAGVNLGGQAAEGCGSICAGRGELLRRHGMLDAGRRGVVGQEVLTAGGGSTWYLRAWVHIREDLKHTSAASRTSTPVRGAFVTSIPIHDGYCCSFGGQQYPTTVTMGNERSRLARRLGARREGPLGQPVPSEESSARHGSDGREVGRVLAVLAFLRA
jgi:hypothetical protein